MSRIQEILAKAERDGTTARTAPSAVVPPPPVGLSVGSAIDGTAALNPSPLRTPGLGGSIVLPQAEPLSPARPDAVEPRTAHATVHPTLVSAIAPHSDIAEQYRGIRTRLTLHEEGRPLRTILITSPEGREGKSVTAANLALAMAQEFQRNVLLIDAQLRSPSVHALFGLEATPGLVDALTGDVTLDEALVYLPEHRLTLLPAGSMTPFPTELLGSTAMRRALDTLRTRFDRILLDLPAVAPLADVGTVAPLGDAVIMVVRAGMTQRPALDAALEVFEEHKVIGVVLNDSRE